MKVIGIRELKDRLSEYLRLVRRKESILISNRGEIVAEIRPSYGSVAGAEMPAGLRELADRGSLRLARSNAPEVYPVLGPLLPEGCAAALLDRERGER